MQVIINRKYATGNILLLQETVNVKSVRLFDPCYLGSHVRKRDEGHRAHGLGMYI